MSTGQKIGVALLVTAFLGTKIWLFFHKPTGMAIAIVGALFLILDNSAGAE